jgi:uncharacterized protein involved in outer membrane biogenesis
VTTNPVPDPKPARRGAADDGSARRTRQNAPREGAPPRRFPKPGRKTLAWSGGVLAMLAVAITVLIAVWDWNWFRAPVAHIASARIHREVTIAGDLNVHPWSWQPSATVDGVHIANPAWASKDGLADIDRIAVGIRLLPLLTGHVDLPLLRFDRPTMRLLRDAQGRATWDFSDGRDKNKPLRLPPIRNFIINDGKLAFEDAKRNLRFSGTINAAETLGARNRGFELTGVGSLNRQPFTLAVRGGPLLNIDRDKPYPFDADLRAGATYVTARGAVPKPFDLGHFYMLTSVRGPDLSDLYLITGIALPNSPPYSLHGRLSRDDKIWRVAGLGGRVGDSDLAGDASVTLGGERPLLKADLTTRSLDFDDLGTIFGGAPSTKAGETASPDQQALARTLTRTQRLMPDTTLNTDRFRSIDADVTFRALSIRDAPIHLKAASAKVKLDAGLMRAEPLALDLPQGRVSGYVQLDARKHQPVTDLDLRLSNGRLEQLVPVSFQGSTPYAGSLVGRARLTGTGDSVHKAFANANGEVMLVAPGGEIRESVAQLLGVNVIKGLGLLFAKDKETTPIRCGVAHFQARNGVLSAGQIVFDTGPTLVTGRGTIDMDTERLDFRLQGHPKKLQIVRLSLPVTVGGTLLKPKVGVETGKAIRQGGVAVALATLLSPLAVILPFVDSGLAKDANCAALLADGAAEGAPVKTARAGTPKAR